MKYKYNGQWYDLTLPAFDSLPVGSEIGYWGDTIPNNYLKEDGKQYLIADYPELYDVLGHRYDLPTDNDSTKFRVPNKCGRVGVGLDTSQTEFDTLGETGGSKYLQAHTHTYNETYADGYQYSGGNLSNVANAVKVSTTSSAGTGNSGNLQPYIVVNYIIKAHPSAVNTSEVVNEHSTSETDVYSANYVNEKFGGTILYSNSTGTIGDVTLNSNLSNYSYIEIYGYHSIFNDSVYTKVDLSLNKSINVSTITTNEQQHRLITQTYTKGTNKLTRVYAWRTTILDKQIVEEGSTTGEIYITKVIGYK